MELTPLVDCRSLDEFCQGHSREAYSIPVAELSERMHELPRNTIPLGLCGKAADLQQAYDFLISKGYQISEQLLWSESLRQQLQAQGELITGLCQRRLWQPSSLLEYFVNVLMPNHDLKPGKGVDIACGSGRDMVYLATQGWQMLGIDYLSGALQRAEALAKRNQVSIQTLLRDMETAPNPFADLPEAGFDLVHVARYLHRPLFPALQQLVAPGGVVVYQTFMQGAEKFGSPRNPNYLLKPGELASVFANMEILLDAVEYLDDGRPVSAFVARRPH